MEKPFTIKPKFWGDGLWFYPALMLIFAGGFSLMMYRLMEGKPEWLGLALIMNILILPIFFLLWLDNLSNRVVFEDDQVIIKGFLHKKKIPYRHVKDITFSDLQNAGLVYFNEKRNQNDYLYLPVWNHSINLVIDEMKKRTDIQVEGYPTKVNRANFFAKIWMLVILGLVVAFFDVIFWHPPKLNESIKKTSMIQYK